MNVASFLLRSARARPDAPAVFHGEAALHDYATLARRASALAASLRGTLGLVTGDRVAIFAHNGPAYLELLHAAWIAGLVAVPVNCKLHPREVAFILADSGAAALFVSGSLAAGLAPLLPGLPELRHAIEIDGRDFGRLAGAATLEARDLPPDALAWLFYTSGTTGRPKGVMLSHRNLMAMTLCYFVDVDLAAPADAAVYAAPMSHGAGLYVLPNMRAGVRHVLPASGAFDAAEFLALARHHGDATAFAAPTMVKRLVDQAERDGHDGTGLRTLVYGGGPMYLADIERARGVLGERFVQIYGQGESPMTITVLSRAHHADAMHPRRDARLASVGVAHTAVEVRVADAQGRTLPPGSPGEVNVRGETVMQGYWRNPDATAETLVDGWLRTGDVGALDADGFLTLLDRSKDVVISGGANIYPREVEEALLHHAGVDEACVVGQPDAEWGEVVVAFVVRRPGVDVDGPALDRVCLDHIARFKRPKAYRFVDALPKNNYGKVIKRDVRAWLDAPAAPGSRAGDPVPGDTV